MPPKRTPKAKVHKDTYNINLLFNMYKHILLYLILYI